MATKTTKLEVEIRYDPNVTDPEGLACALDRLMETALSTPDILDDYGNPRIGEFFVVPQPSKWALYNDDLKKMATSQVFDTYAEAAEAADQYKASTMLVLPLCIADVGEDYSDLAVEDGDG
jgi:hypothetical protein